ncbi:MAG: signal peptide peptidase SppA [Pirellulaceae bacterium]
MRFLAVLAVVTMIAAPVPLRADEKEADKKKEADTKDASGTVIPVFSFDRSYTEMPGGDDFPFATAAGESFLQMLTRLKRAGNDDQVAAILFLGNSTSLGTAQVEEVRQAMDAIKAKDKEIYVHGESMTMRSYVLYSGASHVSVVPTGDLFLTGLRAESMHVRGLLDLVGVVPDFLTCGDFKSAGEMFTHKKPSPEAAKNLNWLLDGLFDSYVTLISEGRKVEPDTVRKWIDQGLYSAERAKAAGIIDAVEFRTDFIAAIKAKHGDKIKFDKKYGKKKQTEIDFSSPFGVLKFYAELLGGPTSTKSKKAAVAIVYVEGPILAGKGDSSSFPFGTQGLAYSTPIRAALDKVANDDSVKAVVLRVNSPGGSAVGSEVILEATRRVKAEKPFVVSMGDVAGSGGYYVACAADTIFADPATITASIGVVGGKLVTTAAWEKVGINFESYERGKSAAMMSSSRKFSDQEREALQSWMNEVYEVFKGHVIAIRGDRLKKEIGELAGGRVFTGKQALELGLVDRLGGLNDAVQLVAKQAGVKEFEIRVVPRPKGFADILRESLMGEEEDGELLSAPSIHLPLGGKMSISKLALPYLQGLEPSRMDSIGKALQQLEILQEERTSLVMPIIGIR